MPLPLLKVSLAFMLLGSLLWTVPAKTQAVVPRGCSTPGLPMPRAQRGAIGHDLPAWLSWPAGSGQFWRSDYAEPLYYLALDAFYEGDLSRHGAINDLVLSWAEERRGPQDAKHDKASPKERRKLEDAEYDRLKPEELEGVGVALVEWMAVMSTLYPSLLSGNVDRLNRLAEIERHRIEYSEERLNSETDPVHHPAPHRFGIELDRDRLAFIEGAVAALRGDEMRMRDRINLLVERSEFSPPFDYRKLPPVSRLDSSSVSSASAPPPLGRLVTIRFYISVLNLLMPDGDDAETERVVGFPGDWLDEAPEGCLARERAVLAFLDLRVSAAELLELAFAPRTDPGLRTAKRERSGNELRIVMERRNPNAKDPVYAVREMLEPLKAMPVLLWSAVNFLHRERRDAIDRDLGALLSVAVPRQIAELCRKRPGSLLCITNPEGED